jgi:hypothetical protein
MSGYRDAELNAQCSRCLRVATSACLRCGRPLCEDHAHGEKTRCRRCELAYASLTPLVAGGALLATLAAAPAFLLTGRPRLASPTLLSRFQQRRRRKFLEQRPKVPG